MEIWVENADLSSPDFIEDSCMNKENISGQMLCVIAWLYDMNFHQAHKWKQKYKE